MCACGAAGIRQALGVRSHGKERQDVVSCRVTLVLSRHHPIQQQRACSHKCTMTMHQQRKQLLWTGRNGMMREKAESSQLEVLDFAEEEFDGWLRLGLELCLLTLRQLLQHLPQPGLLNTHIHVSQGES